ncbi:hypothetical protein [Mycobacterium sp. SMC-4]|uniref:hypothetical protein n=1 Tax=Mycobacterium sp. SMC-4 TaxID=2857059 RepID=UPI0021B3352F|nr:hypothetical protein [Mycobacterium sp. SMC-4]UXA20069.1 hypothetical protein KXD98_11065 [Mycobacterium sp. SMC-4]
MLATDAAEVVSAAGGLIYDSVSTGWQVEVHLEHSGDTRALTILGTRSHDLPKVADYESEWPDILFLAAALLERRQHVRRLVTSLTRHQRTDVAVWGASALPPQLGMSSNFDYRLSNAAVAFKRQAMAAAGLAVTGAGVETFRCGQHLTTAVPPFATTA